MPGRRRFLQAALAAGILPLAGCRELIDIIGSACPEDPADTGGIDWTPDVLHPVFYGVQHFTAGQGAPGTLSVLYPSHQTFAAGERTILKSCLDRWPLVLFLHGQPPCLSDPAAHRKWRRIAIMLASSGYVVAVPRYDAALPQDGSPLVTFALQVIDWVRNSWEHAEWVDKRPEAVAIAGHSYGALLAARVAQARPETGAYVGLSGPWEEFHSFGIDPLSVLQGIGAPSLFMWSTDAFFENMDHGGLFDALPAPRHAMVHDGQHFDYLAPGDVCDKPRGACPWIERVAAELTALFLARYLLQARSDIDIPVDLVPPPVTLTPKQQFYGGADFTGLQAIASDRACSAVDLRWLDGDEAGTRKLGP